MGKKIALEIGGLSFPTKGAAEEYFRSMLYRYDLGVTIGEPDSTELGWLIERHPELKSKIGSGVTSFSVRRALYKTRCFEINRTDGTSTDFSFRSCVNGKVASSQSQLLTALRAEVASDILDKKRAWFTAHGDDQGKVPCAITGLRVAFEESHADHAPPRPFGTLAIAFLAAREIEPTLDLITPPADNQYQPVLVDRELAKAWISYHHQVAVIRIVAKGANLARAHEGKVKDRDRQLKLT